MHVNQSFYHLDVSHIAGKHNLYLYVVQAKEMELLPSLEVELPPFTIHLASFEFITMASGETFVICSMTLVTMKPLWYAVSWDMSEHLVTPRPEERSEFFYGISNTY